MVRGCQYCAIYMYGIGSMICARYGYDSVGCGHACGQGCDCLSVLLDLWEKMTRKICFSPKGQKWGREATWLWQFPLVPLFRGSMPAVSTSVKGRKKDCTRKRRKVLSPNLFI